MESFPFHLIKTRIRQPLRQSDEPPFLFPMVSDTFGSTFFATSIGAITAPATGMSEEAAITAISFFVFELFLFTLCLLLIFTHSYLLVFKRRVKIGPEIVIHMIPEIVHLVVVSAK